MNGPFKVCEFALRRIHIELIAIKLKTPFDVFNKKVKQKFFSFEMRDTKFNLTFIG